MNRLGKSLITVFLFLMSTAFLFSSHADGNDTFANVGARNNAHPKKIATERERGTMDLPANAEVRTKRLLVGLWGGEHIRLEITAQGATIEYDCAHGTIERRIYLDRRGSFNVSGTQVQERGGPVRQDEQSNGYPVRFIGQVNGKRMKLTVRNSVTKELVGNFTLVYGAESRLMKCK
jgi:hypothetical protein